MSDAAERLAQALRDLIHEAVQAAVARECPTPPPARVVERPEVPEEDLELCPWSTNNARALAMAERIQAGGVWINDAHQINCQLPFGGYKQSGLGRELGPAALDAYTEVKTVALDLPGGRATKPYDLLLSHADG